MMGCFIVLILQIACIWRGGRGGMRFQWIDKSMGTVTFDAGAVGADVVVSLLC